MDIKGLDKARVLKALWNNSNMDMIEPMCMLLNVSVPKMSTEEARAIIEKKGGNLYFDYLRSRVIKTDIGPDYIDLLLYNRDNGHESGENAILEEFTNPQSE